MKKTMNILGAIGIILFSLGLFFRFFHWPFGPLLLLASGLLFVPFFLPAYGYSLFKELTGGRSKTAAVFGAITFCLVGLATLFKLNHWPFAGPLILLENVFAGLVAIPVLMVHRVRLAANRKQKAALISGHLALSVIIMGILFKIMHWPGGAQITFFGTALALFVYLPITLSRFNTVESRSTLRNRVGIVAVLAFMIYAIFGTGISNAIWYSFVSLEESIKESEAGPVVMKDSYYYIVDQLSKGDSLTRNEELCYARVKKVRELSDNLYNDIEKLKAVLISRTDGGSDETPSRKISSIDAKDNWDTPTNILIGDRDNPNNGAYSATELKAKINVYRQDMISMYPDNVLRERAEKTIVLKTPDVFSPDEGGNVKWEVYNFNQKPIVSVITMLSKLQLDVRNTETSTVEFLYKMSQNVGISKEDVAKGIDYSNLPAKK